MVKVLVNGALGRMGREVLKAATVDKEVQLVGAVDINAKEETIGSVINVDNEIKMQSDLAKALEEHKPDVVVDFTQPAVVMNNLRTILAKGVRAVVGTTGFTKENFEELENLAKQNSTAVLIAPNFSIGAILMMKFAEQAVKYLPKAEIIELHHDQKLDAPSGTARITAERMAAARGGFIQQGHPDEKELLQGARGANVDGINIHSVRLPGFVAHQEVIFGGLGESLVIRHDSNSRESFMPGVILACHKIPNYTGFIYGLDKIMD